MDKKEIVFRLEQLPGRVGFFYKNLQTGESFGLHHQEEFLAASVIKLPVYAVIMKLAAEGQIDLSRKSFSAGRKISCPPAARCISSPER